MYILCNNTKPTAHPSVDFLRTMCRRSCVTMIFQNRFVEMRCPQMFIPTVDRSFAQLNSLSLVSLVMERDDFPMGKSPLPQFGDGIGPGFQYHRAKRKHCGPRRGSWAAEGEEDDRQDRTHAIQVGKGWEDDWGGAGVLIMLLRVDRSFNWIYCIYFLYNCTIVVYKYRH